MQKDQLTKREQCVNLIKKMARQMSMPKEIITQLDALDLSVATDDQVEIIHSHLVRLINETDKIKHQSGVNLFKQIKAINN